MNDLSPWAGEPRVQHAPEIASLRACVDGGVGSSDHPEREDHGILPVSMSSLTAYLSAGADSCYSTGGRGRVAAIFCKICTTDCSSCDSHRSIAAVASATLTQKRRRAPERDTHNKPIEKICAHTRRPQCR